MTWQTVSTKSVDWSWDFSIYEDTYVSCWFWTLTVLQNLPLFPFLFFLFSFTNAKTTLEPSRRSYTAPGTSGCGSVLFFFPGCNGRWLKQTELLSSAHRHNRHATVDASDSPFCFRWCHFLTSIRSPVASSAALSLSFVLFCLKTVQRDLARPC